MPKSLAEIDDIIFRCFAQGQYWGTEKDGKLDPDYKPENPIDRTEANRLINSLIAAHQKEVLEFCLKYPMRNDVVNKLKDRLASLEGK